MNNKILHPTEQSPNEGHLEAKAKGIRFGPKPWVNKDEIRRLKSTGLGPTAIARQMKIGRSTVHKVLAEREK